MADYDLKRNVMVWLDLDDKLKAIRKKVREMNKEKNGSAKASRSNINKPVSSRPQMAAPQQ